MGAEQSALTASTETGSFEKPLRMTNAELYFRGTKFNAIAPPSTGPVTEALLHMVNEKSAKLIKLERGATKNCKQNYNSINNKMIQTTFDEEALSDVSEEAVERFSESDIETASSSYSQDDEHIDFDVQMPKYIEVEAIEAPEMMPSEQHIKDTILTTEPYKPKIVVLSKPMPKKDYDENTDAKSELNTQNTPP